MQLDFEVTGMPFFHSAEKLGTLLLIVHRLRDIVREDGLSGIGVRVSGRVKRWATSQTQEFLARRWGSYGQSPRPLNLQPRLHDLFLGPVPVGACIPAEVARHYLNHRFDLLGSGWVQVRYGMPCRGLAGYRYAMGETLTPDAAGEWLNGRINAANLPKSKVVWQQIDAGYQPIDWQIDFKSGFRWSEAVWAKKLKYAHLPGVDVKVPWELARMQHLPQLALRALALRQDDEEEGRRVVREARNQILDFIATNPPGFGVNWLCPMDVAIRATNWLLTWDIFRAGGFTFESDMEAVFAESIHDHGRFVVQNLEWSPQRGNHYLSHICGLVFIAVYLPETEKTNGWLAFAIEQLHIETFRQFHPDGGNIEGSVAYHRLTAEMVLYAIAVILGLPESRLRAVTEIDLKALKLLPSAATGTRVKIELHPNAEDTQGANTLIPFNLTYIDRLARLISFFEGVLKTSGNFPQIGDNDSGRFFKVHPVFTEIPLFEAKLKYANLLDYSELPDVDTYFFEEPLHGVHLLNAASALAWRPSCVADESIRDKKDKGIDFFVVTALANGRKLSGFKEIPNQFDGQDGIPYGANPCFMQIWNEIQGASNLHREIFRFALSPGRKGKTLILNSYPDFGCYVFKHPSFYLAVRCLTRSIGKVIAHFHEDQLSLELDIDGHSVIRDPGTYVYTALPSERNRYRTCQSHFAPGCHKRSALSQESGVFSPIQIQPAIINYFGPNGFAAGLEFNSSLAGLLLRIKQDSIEILHYNSNVNISIGKNMNQLVYYSPGYGILEQLIK